MTTVFSPAIEGNMRARHYDPASGRFLQADPLGVETDHLYAYAANNPYVYWDPSGLFKTPISRPTQSLALNYAEAGIRTASTRSIGSAAPRSSPQSNLAGGALGFFGVTETQRTTTQLGLAGAGAVPALGIFPDAANVIVDLLAFDFGAAAIDTAAAVPGYGLAAAPLAIGVRTSRGVRALPRLDATGKVHGDLPRVQDFGSYSPTALRDLAGELQQSVRTRIQRTVELGPDKAHGQRQSAEQQLIIQIEKFLGGS
jgi:hypothetical protein